MGPLIKPGSLRTRLIETTAHALKCGAQQPVATESHIVEEDDIRFIVRILARIAAKDRARAAQRQQAEQTGTVINPFLPPDPDLLVAELTNTHCCLLNKFNVLDLHCLIVTRHYEEQECLLTEQDLAAMWLCLSEMDGLAFYNGGEVAGASQPHKHLQFVPLPLAPSEAGIPLEKRLTPLPRAGTVARSRALPFRHALAGCDPRWKLDPEYAGRTCLRLYREMLEMLGMPWGRRQSAPYNLLATERWMLLVPRSGECWQSVSINALGFAGALLVRTSEQLEALREHGCMGALESVVADGAA